MGGKTPDRFPGTREEDELFLEPASNDPTAVGAVRSVSGRFRFRDDDGVFDPREAAAGISEASHKILRQLIHFIEDGPADGFVSGAYKETLGGLFPTQITWWESSLRLKKIVEKIITRTGGGATVVTPTPVLWKMYDTDGVSVLVTATDVITYTGIVETSRLRTFA